MAGLKIVDREFSVRSESLPLDKPVHWDVALGSQQWLGQLAHQLAIWIDLSTSNMSAYPHARPREIHGTTRVLFLRKEGETIQFLSTSSDTRGQRSEIVFSIPAGQEPSRPHRHLHQQEEVEVLSGSMYLRIQGKKITLRQGENVVIRPGQPHTVWNASKSERLVVRVAFSPACNMEWYFTQMACSAIRNGGSWKDVPVLEAAIIHFALRREYRIANIPYVIQYLIFGTLTMLAKVTGAIKNIRPLSLYKAYVR